MRIVDALIEVLTDNEKLTYKEAYKRIVEQGLYHFGAKNPEAAVNAKLRCHCVGLDFPGASPIKYFKIVGQDGTRNLYALASPDDLKANDEGVSHDNIDEKSSDADFLPEEKIESTFKEYNTRLKKEIIEHIVDCDPSFFEQLVVSLLLEMGYGADEHSGHVIGKSHDGGIDGVIFEDRLGLSKIYIQAKRYDKERSIGRPTIQSFVGAMLDVQKGVFITTSSFTNEATKFAENQQQKSLKLIDGNNLAELMIRYGVGLEKIQTYTLYKVNEDFFNS